jgi:hypothetical protein
MVMAMKWMGYVVGKGTPSSACRYLVAKSPGNRPLRLKQMKRPKFHISPEITFPH